MDIPRNDDLHPGCHRLRHLGRFYRGHEDFLKPPISPLSLARNPNVVDQACLSDEDGQRDERFALDPLQGSEVHMISKRTL